jgi:DNA-binding YbaB/EbfC family protein
MFKEMSQILGLLQQGPRIREEMTRLQERISRLTAEADAGAGLVRARVNGRFEVVGVEIASDALADRELLEGLTVAAINQALEKVRQLAAEETSRAMTALGLPPGMALPGLF